ncbi:MAG TPA: type II toxin-antitoxin system VapC family toxin [Anaerolineae bacterium]|nr:type II toxin-antitoxin system VapC family toxin [Anaerolineae bacterium]
MADYYLDASALVKRYATEPGSAHILAITDVAAGNAVILAEITLVEVASALAGKQRASRDFSLEDRDRALSRFLQECAEQFLLFRVGRDVIDQAVELTQKHRLRAYDAVQLASALLANRILIEQNHPSLTFVVADADLLAAAQAEGLPIENPTQ